MSNYHITNPKGADGWKVLKEGAKRSAAVVDTQKEAEKLAKGLAHKSGGGEVRIHRPNGGPIRDSDTVRPAKDPNPPVDKKH